MEKRVCRFRVTRSVYGQAEDRKGNWLRRTVVCDPPEEPQELLLGYELMAGLAVAYVEPEIYRKGVQAGLIDAAEELPPQLRFEEVWTLEGEGPCEALRQAMLGATVETLEQALEEQTDRYKNRLIRFRVYDMVQRKRGREPMEDVLLDPMMCQVRECCFAPEERWAESFYIPMFHKEMDYAQCVETLARGLCCRFQNVGDLLSLHVENFLCGVDRFLERQAYVDFDLIEK